MNLDTTADYPVHQSKQFPWGCLFGGCLVVFLVMLGGMGLVGYTGYRFYQGQIAKYTSDVGKELPIVEMSEEELAELEQRVELFQEKLEKGETSEELILTQDDINALISKQENFRGHVYVSIEEGQLSAEVSVSTDDIPGANGRFFNGEVTVDASLENGVLIVTVQDASVNGASVPEEFMQAIRGENIAKEAYKDPENAKWLRKFESLVIQDDKIILTPVSKPAVETETPMELETPVGTAAEGSETESTGARG